MNFTQEQIVKAKSAKSVEALLAYAKEIDFKLTEDEAKAYFDQWHKEGELSDDELDNVAGGSFCIDGRSYGDEFPHFLITTLYNYCPGYQYQPLAMGILASDSGECCDCNYRLYDNGINYCSIRTADRDPYR